MEKIFSLLKRVEFFEIMFEDENGGTMKLIPANFKGVVEKQEFVGKITFFSVGDRVFVNNAINRIPRCIPDHEIEIKDGNPVV